MCEFFAVPVVQARMTSRVTIETLVIGREHGNDDIGQKNGTNAANVA